VIKGPKPHFGASATVRNHHSCGPTRARMS
jgi:hypothetical protein